MIVIAALFTEFTDASVSPSRLLLGVGAAFVATASFVLMGFAIGYPLPAKAAIGVAQIRFFPVAIHFFPIGILGGLMSGTGLPSFIAAVAPYMPSGGAVDLGGDYGRADGAAAARRAQRLERGTRGAGGLGVPTG